MEVAKGAPADLGAFAKDGTCTGYWLDKDVEEMVVARIGGAEAGAISFRFVDDHVHVDHLHVLKAHRRKGVGRRLLAEAERSCLKRGGRFVRLYPTAEALEFYWKMRFFPTDRDEKRAFLDWGRDKVDRLPYVGTMSRIARRRRGQSQR